MSSQFRFRVATGLVGHLVELTRDVINTPDRFPSSSRARHKAQVTSQWLHDAASHNRKKKKKEHWLCFCSTLILLSYDDLLVYFNDWIFPWRQTVFLVDVRQKQKIGYILFDVRVCWSHTPLWVVYLIYFSRCPVLLIGCAFLPKREGVSLSFRKIS